MDCRWRYVEQLQKDGLIKVSFVPTDENVSDVATKNVKVDTMEAHNEVYLLDKKDIGPDPEAGRVLATNNESGLSVYSRLAQTQD